VPGGTARSRHARCGAVTVNAGPDEPALLVPVYSSRGRSICHAISAAITIDTTATARLTRRMIAKAPARVAAKGC
jgi:hypothetical protein